MSGYRFSSDDARTSAEDPTRTLPPAEGRLRMVLDTDAANEVDDQFAITYALLAPERLSVEAIYAAPFAKEGVSPAEGMSRSYDEIHRVLDHLGRSPREGVHRGATRNLADEADTVESPAVADLIRRGLTATPEQPLYVVSIGAATNVASAIQLEPALLERIVVVWLGGHPAAWPTASEFNLNQDPPAVRRLFGAGGRLVHIPCKNVAEHLRTTLAELDAYLAGRHPIADYLTGLVHQWAPHARGWSKVIWDIANIAYLINPAWLPSQVTPSPVLSEDLTWAAGEDRPAIRTAVDVNRDAVFLDFYSRIDTLAGEARPADVVRATAEPA